MKSMKKLGLALSLIFFFMPFNNALATNIGGVSVGKVNPDGTSTWKNYSTAHGLGSDIPSGINISDDGRMILVPTQESAVSVYDQGGLSVGTVKPDGSIDWMTYTKADGLRSNDIDDVFFKDNTIYAATNEGVAIKKSNEQKFTTFTTADGLGGNWIRKIFVDKNNAIYAATSEGLGIKKAGEQKFKNITTADGLGSNCILGIYVDNENTIYAATISHRGAPGGLSIGRVRDGKIVWTNYTTAQGLPSNDVMFVYVDEKKNIYVATFHQQLSVSKDGGNTWSNLTGLAGNQVTDIQVKDGVIYAATYSHPIGSDDRGGLSISKDEGKTWKHYTTNDGLYSNYIVGVKVDKNNNIYLARWNNPSDTWNIECPEPSYLVSFLKNHGVDPSAREHFPFGFGNLMWKYTNTRGITPVQNHLAFSGAYQEAHSGFGYLYCTYRTEDAPSDQRQFVLEAATKWVSPPGKYWKYDSLYNSWSCNQNSGGSSVKDCLMAYTFPH